jgi:hypothetical protein
MAGSFRRLAGGRVRPALFIALVLFANAAAADYRSDFEKLCNAEQLSGASKFKDQAQRASKVTEFMYRPDFGDEVKSFLAQLSASDTCDKPLKMRAEAARLGLSGCALADSTEKESKKACANRPTLKDDIIAMCNAEKNSGADKVRDAEERFAMVHRHLLARVTRQVSAEFRDFLTQINNEELCQRGKTLERKAAEVGANPCPLAARWKVDLCKPHKDDH